MDLIFTVPASELLCGRCGSNWVDRDEQSGYVVLKCCKCPNMSSERYMSKWGFVRKNSEEHRALIGARAMKIGAVGQGAAAWAPTGPKQVEIIVGSEPNEYMGEATGEALTPDTIPEVKEMKAKESSADVSEAQDVQAGQGVQTIDRNILREAVKEGIYLHERFPAVGVEDLVVGCYEYLTEAASG